MSRIGKQPINIPAGVTVQVSGRSVTASGPKGALEVQLLNGLTVEQADSTIVVKLQQDNPETQRSYGLMRTLIDNIVQGVSQGFQRSLEINGVGYRAAVSGKSVNLSLGFSHPIEVKLPETIEAKVERNVLTISGPDKQLVGQVAANIRKLRKPEPYKGKGIRYTDEYVRRKAGKTAAKG